MFNRRFLYAALTSTLALLFHINATAQSVDRSQTIKEIDSLRKQLSEKEKLSLRPSAEDKVAFKYGFIVMLGDVSIEEVTDKHDGVKFLADYRPARSEPVARAEFQRSRDGIRINGYKYASRAPVIVNQTYALRSIVYDSSDVLVTFRAVREESNGSVVIVWKMLKRFFTPGAIRS